MCGVGRLPFPGSAGFCCRRIPHGAGRGGPLSHGTADSIPHGKRIDRLKSIAYDTSQPQLSVSAVFYRGDVLYDRLCPGDQQLPGSAAGERPSDLLRGVVPCHCGDLLVVSHFRIPGVDADRTHRIQEDDGRVVSDFRPGFLPVHPFGRQRKPRAVSRRVVPLRNGQHVPAGNGQPLYHDPGTCRERCAPDQHHGHLQQTGVACGSDVPGCGDRQGDRGGPAPGHQTAVPVDYRHFSAAGRCRLAGPAARGEGRG